MRGVIVPIVTPFKEDYSIDVPALEEHLDYLQKVGVHGIFINATTGEFTSLSKEERRFLAEKGRELVTSAFYLVGTASSNTLEVIELTKHAQDIGADYAVIAPPYYCPLTEEALFRHYSMIAEKTDIPIILYNIPACANSLSVPLVKRLTIEYPSIAGIKATLDSVNYIRDIILDVEGRKERLQGLHWPRPALPQHADPRRRWRNNGVRELCTRASSTPLQGLQREAL